MPTDFSGELLFEQEVSASFYCSFVAANQQWAKISGEQGYLELEDFVLPFNGSELQFETQKAKFHVAGCDFKMEPHMRNYSVQEHSHGLANAQESNLFRNFSNQVLSGCLNAVWPEIAFKTQRIACACLDSARLDGREVSIE